MRPQLDKILMTSLIVLMSIMILSTLLQVGGRLCEINVPFTEELTIYGMMWTTLFGSVYAFGLKQHIAIDVLSNSIKDENRWKLEVVVEVIVMVFAVLVLIMGGIRFVYITFKLGQVSAVMQIPKGWIYLALPLSGLLIIWYNLLNIMQTLKNRVKA